MKRLLAIGTMILFSGAAHASGLYECEPVDRAQWLTEEKLTEIVLAGGWQEVRRMKPDGGCWEVYGTTAEGDRVEGYFDPVTGEKLLVAQRGRVLFRKGE